MTTEELIDRYLAGPKELREAIAGMSPKELDAAPVPGKRSTRWIICHIADFEPVYADRMKRVLVEDNPTLLGGDPDRFGERLAYDARDLENELRVIESTRQQIATILRTIDLEDWQRTGVHTEDGPMTLETLLERITGHVPHHIAFIAEKREKLVDRGS